MIRIGEKLNSSIPTTQKMFDERDRDAVVALIEKQEEAGADYLDINTALCADSWKPCSGSSAWPWNTATAAS